jgi:alkylated DNA repair protein (DNA oxidative demethylase)
MRTGDLFHNSSAEPDILRLDEGAWLLKRHAAEVSGDLLAGIDIITQSAPWRHMVVPGGHEMSVAMTNCGTYGWVSERQGYRYASHDPMTGQPWPPIPDAFMSLATRAAEMAGFTGFVPDACLINRYAHGAKMGLHQDKDEQDMTQPIVSVSLGLPAVFQFGGFKRADKAERVWLEHGDIVVWGGADRLRYHGIQALKAGTHEATGEYRYNLTFRKAR